MKTKLWDSLAAFPDWLAHNALHSALPALLVAWVCWRRWGSARVRFALAALVLAKLVLPALPGFSWSLSLPAEPAAAAETSPASPSWLVATTEAPATDSLPPAPATGLPWWAALWLLGVATLAVWWLAGHHKIQRWIRRHRQSSPVWLRRLLEEESRRMGAANVPELCVLRGWPQAAVHGWRRPRLLVPESWLARLTEAEWRVVLRHELAHVRRHDVLWSALGFAIATLHWFHPLGWLALRRLRAESELLCDEAALAGHGESGRRDYGRLLVRLIEPFTPAPPQPVAAFARHRTDIQHRIHMIAQPNRTQRWSRAAAWLIFPVLSLTLLTAGEKGNPKSEARSARETGERASREGEREGARKRDGEIKKEGPRDGERTMKGPRDGERPREGVRDGDRPREGAREGDRPREGMKEGEDAKRSVEAIEHAGKTTITADIGLELQLNAAGEVVNEGRVIPDDDVKQNISQIVHANPGKKILLVLRGGKDMPFGSGLRFSNLLKGLDVKVVHAP